MAYPTTLIALITDIYSALGDFMSNSLASMANDLGARIVGMSLFTAVCASELIRRVWTRARHMPVLVTVIALY